MIDAGLIEMIGAAASAEDRSWQFGVWLWLVGGVTVLTPVVAAILWARLRARSRSWKEAGKAKGTTQ